MGPIDTRWQAPTWIVASAIGLRLTSAAIAAAKRSRRMTSGRSRWQRAEVNEATQSTVKPPVVVESSVGCCRGR
jgi:hypothetical protein